MILNITVIGLYFVFLSSIGLVFKKLNADENDYFRAGSRSAWWMVGMSLVMSGISTQTFIANAGVAYTSGFSIWWVYIINGFGAAALGLGIAAWFRQTRITTFAEIIRDRFGTSFQQFFTYWNILWLVIAGSIGLYMLALFAHTAFDLPVPATIIGLGAVVLFYTLTGGNWAVLAADFLQSLVLFSMAILLAVLCLNEIGGIGGFFEAIRERGLVDEFKLITPGREDGLYGLEWLFGVGIIQIYAMLGMQGGQRFFSCKDGFGARKAAWLYCVVGLIGMVIYFIPPMVGRLLFAPEIEAAHMSNPADLSYVFMAIKLLPFGFVPLMVVAMFSAQMSTLDTALNANSAIFVKNGYPALMRLCGREPRTDHKFLLRLGRVFTLFLGLALISCALFFSTQAREGSIFELTFRINALLAIPLLLPMFLGFLIRKTPMISGWTCFLAALAASIVCAILEIPSFRIAFFNSFAGIAAFLGTGLLWNRVPAEERARLQEFFTRMHTPVDFEKEVGGGNDRLQKKLVGTLATALGGFIALFLLLPNDAAARLAIFLVAAAVGSVGVLFLYASRRDEPLRAEL